MTERILRRPNVEDRTEHSRSTIYAKLDAKSPDFDPDFPKPVKLGKRAVGRYESSIENYLENLAKKGV